MEAPHQLQKFPIRAFLVGMALVVLALLSAVGGYSLRMLTATTGTTVIRVYQPATNATIQPHPNPDTLDHAGASGSARSIQPGPNPDTLDHVNAR